jgi:trigger factor
MTDTLENKPEAADENKPAEEPKADEAASQIAVEETGAVDGQETEAAEADEADEADGEEELEKLTQEVFITDVGPCRKHIKVTVDRGNIDKLLEKEYSKLVGDAWVPGFRPGKAPKKIVVQRFAKDVKDQIRGQVLMQSLEQLAEEHDVAPISPPNINPAKIQIPDKGPFIYEFEVEVRPQFDLPEYKGLKLTRPIKTFTDAEVEAEEKKLLSRYGQLIPKVGAAEVGDYVIADMVTTYEGKKIGEVKETTLRIDDTVAFKDGVAQKFGEQMAGAQAGDTRTIDITMSDAVAVEALRGKTVQAAIEVKDVKSMRLPELTHEFLHNFGVHNPEQLRELVRSLLDRRLEYTQRQSAREQVMQHIAASATWELPNDMLMRQARKTLARRVMDMREAGISEEEIEARQRLLQRDVLASTALALKEHFVLQKIAETEKIEIDEEEMNAEIERLADQTGESPRKVRAQLERDDLMETLATQLIERKSLDLILDSAEYEDVPLEKERGVTAAEAQAVEGEMKDPTAAPPEEPMQEEEKTQEQKPE